MAEKRMFSRVIIDSDAFLEMPLSAQALYFHLSMRADDDGFVGNPQRMRTMVGASEDDLKLLIVKRFLLPFPSGVMVIKHWRLHNTIKSDRYKPTTYIEELDTLTLDGNRAYTEAHKAYTEECEIECLQSGTNLEPIRNQNGTNLEPKWNHRLDKNRLEVSKKEEEKEYVTTTTRAREARESYEEILVRLGFSEDLRKQVFRFIRWLQLNKRIVTNDMLAQMMTDIRAQAENRIRESLPGGALRNMLADLADYADDIESYITASIAQALSGKWYELRPPKGWQTSAEWESEAEEDMAQIQGGKK